MVTTKAAIFRTKIQADGSFPTKFLYATDNKIQLWLGQCKQSTQCDKVNGHLINFQNLVDSILDGFFNAGLPAIFKVLPSTEEIASLPLKHPWLNNHASAGRNAPLNEDEHKVINKNQ